MDVQFAGQPKDVHQTLQCAAVAFVSRVDLRVHQVEHGAEPTGGHADLMELLSVFRPEVLLQQFPQARQADLKGAVKQDRQFSWMHPLILGVVSKEPVLF